MTLRSMIEYVRSLERDVQVLRQMVADRDNWLDHYMKAHEPNPLYTMNANITLCAQDGAATEQE